MQLQFVGCGDAFGSGGRFNTCFHVTGERVNFLIDCGATSLVALKRLDIALNQIQAILFTHFHADHFGGLPFFILDSQFFSKREEPLTLVGPRGLTDWVARAMETAFPGSSKTSQRFEIAMLELDAGERVETNGLLASAYQAEHGNPGGPFLAYRIEAEGRVIAYSGDSQWCEGLREAGRNADLFIAEAYFRDKEVPLHLDLASLERHLPEIAPKRLILTHMSDDMLRRAQDLPYQLAEDGMIVTL